LLDHDLALNNGGWQWAASTGTDAQPWFRIFNPVEQSKKFDPEGTYIKKYVPELSKVDTRFIHEPWKTPLKKQYEYACRIGKDYPSPMVEHAQRRLIALEAYKKLSDDSIRFSE
jgi:deoxyribodipyrimidine photo-lyase